MATPLGKYAAPAAAIIAVSAVLAYLAALILPLGVTADNVDKLGFVAIAALGAVFGSAVTINGYRAPVSALGARLDTHTSQIAALAGIVADSHPTAAPAVEAIVSAAASTVAGSPQDVPPAAAGGLQSP